MGFTARVAPVTDDAPAGGARAKLDPRMQGRVLFVAEDSHNSVPHTSALEAAGFVVADCAGGIQARLRFRETRPHVVVINTNLRGISHTELARMLLAADASIALVFVGTEEATVARRADALSVGAFDYLRLPVDAPLLVLRIAQLVELRNRTEALRRAADYDYLTGLANRRRFRYALGAEVERFRRYKTPCALLLIDIDFLKRINDQHGHSAGDAAIRRVAELLHGFSRDNDTSARLGGEEFALLLAGIADKQAAIVAERVRQAVSSAPVENIGTITVSLGIAACPAHAISERSLYTASDAALYRAKQLGRDRAEIAPPLM